MKLLCLVFLVLGGVAMAASEAELGPNLVPNGDFTAGLEGWSLATTVNRVAVEQVESGPAPQAVWLSGVGSKSEATVLSEPIPIKPAQAYQLEGQVKALIGEGQYKIALGWLDSEHRHLGWANGWTGLLVRGDWEHHQVRLLAPADAAYAQLNVGITGGDRKSVV